MLLLHVRTIELGFRMLSKLGFIVNYRVLKCDVTNIQIFKIMGSIKDVHKEHDEKCQLAKNQYLIAIWE